MNEQDRRTLRTVLAVLGVTANTAGHAAGYTVWQASVVVGPVEGIQGIFFLSWVLVSLILVWYLLGKKQKA